jgi:hypothetical protein
MPRASLGERGTEVEAGRIERTETPSAPQEGVPAQPPAGRYVIEGDPRGSEHLFDKFADLLRAAYYESVERGTVLIAFYESENETWPPTLIFAQPFGMSLARYAVVLDEDGRPLYVFDVFEKNWGFIADVVLQIAAQHFNLGKIRRIEIEVSGRW